MLSATVLPVIVRRAFAPLTWMPPPRAELLTFPSWEMFSTISLSVIVKADSVRNSSPAVMRS